MRTGPYLEGGHGVVSLRERERVPRGFNWEYRDLGVPRPPDSPRGVLARGVQPTAPLG
jgi:hypothetical protein